MRLLGAAESPVEYLPIITTVMAAGFSVVLWHHWRRSHTRYVLWWLLGVSLFGLGTLAEAATVLAGWHELLFRLWYIAGALLGGAPLAQGTVYLLFRRRTADRLAATLVVYVTFAAVFVLSTPVVAPADGRLDGDAMVWEWVRFFSPVVNSYAVVFLVGGAGWSAWRYRSLADRPMSRVSGNALIAVGALLPGIGGAFSRAGVVEVLYVMEIVGLSLIWLGYRAIAGDSAVSIHAVQRAGSTGPPPSG